VPIKIRKKNKKILANFFNKFAKKISCNMRIFSNDFKIIENLSKKIRSSRKLNLLMKSLIR